MVHQQLRSVTAPLNRFYVLWRLRNHRRIIIIIIIIVQLIKTKCFRVLYYGLEACPLLKSQFSTLCFVVNSTFRKKVFDRSQEVLRTCLELCNCVSAEQTVAMRTMR